jgi:hypothetical protein
MTTLVSLSLSPDRSNITAQARQWRLALARLLARAVLKW